MAKAPENKTFTEYGRSYYIYSTIPRNHEETTTTVTPTEDCQTQTHFDRVSSPGRSADTQISFTGSDRAISQSPQEQTESKRLDYCSRCYEGKHNVKTSSIYNKRRTFRACMQSVGNSLRVSLDLVGRMQTELPQTTGNLGLGLRTLLTLL